MLKDGALLFEDHEVDRMTGHDALELGGKRAYEPISAFRWYALTQRQRDVDVTGCDRLSAGE